MHKQLHQEALIQQLSDDNPAACHDMGCRTCIEHTTRPLLPAAAAGYAAAPLMLLGACSWTWTQACLSITHCVSNHPTRLPLYLFHMQRPLAGRRRH